MDINSLKWSDITYMVNHIPFKNGIANHTLVSYFEGMHEFNVQLFFN